MPSDVVDPLVLLTNREDRKPRFLTNLYNPIGCAIGGFGLAAFLNYGFRKPWFSGIQKHFIYAAIGAGLGVYFDKKRNEVVDKRDAVLRHYVELHPDDFPPVQRVKYGDVLEMWVPIR